MISVRFKITKKDIEPQKHRWQTAGEKHKWTRSRHKVYTERSQITEMRFKKNLRDIK